MMLKTSEINMQTMDRIKDVLLDFCKRSETELDYEYVESILESKAGKSEISSTKSNTSAAVIDSVLPKLADTVQPVPGSSKDIPRLKQTTTETGSKFHLQQLKGSDIKFKLQINENQSKTADVLDLHRMAEQFAEAKANLLKKVEKIVYETRAFDYDIVTGVDKLLEEAHTICDRFRKKLDSGTKAKLLNLIANLKELPHTYEHIHRGKLKYNRVVAWLSSSTNRPEPELCGFAMHDPFQLRKFVSDVRPRKSTSDANIALGKRKRSYEDCGIDVQGSSSDTRVCVYADLARPCSSGKRRRN